MGIFTKTEAREAAEQVRQAVADLNQQRANLQQDLAEKTERLAVLQQQHLPMADLKQFVLDLIDAEAVHYLPVLKKGIEELIYPHRDGVHVVSNERKMITFGETERLLKSKNHGPDSGLLPLQKTTENLFEIFRENGDIPAFFLFGDLIKQAIADNFDKLEIPVRNLNRYGIGSDRETRRAEIAALEAEIAAVRNDISQAEMEIRELGGVVE